MAQFVFSFVALEIGYAWDSEQGWWIWAVQHFRGAILSAWQNTVAAELCKRKGFLGKLGFDMFGSHLLDSLHLRERDKMLRVWNGFMMIVLVICGG